MGKKEKAKKAAKAQTQSKATNGTADRYCFTLSIQLEWRNLYAYFSVLCTFRSEPSSPSSPTAGPSTSVLASSKSGSPSLEETTAPEPEPGPLEEEDITKQAEKVKEKGNQSFKAGKYQDAITDYSKAIGASCNIYLD
jgi:hypothetical protein